MAYIFLCLFSFITHYSSPTLYCDVVELNHYYDMNGRIIFDQLICRVWNNKANKHIALSWVILSKSRVHNEADKKAWDAIHMAKDGDNFPYNPEFVPEFKDDTILQRISLIKDSNPIIIAYRYRMYETWTQYDPQTEDKELIYELDLFRRTTNFPPTPNHFVPKYMER